MQKSFTSYKCLMISINLSGRSFLRGDGSQQEAELQDALGSANHSWTQACSSLERWERRLHAALLQCQVRRRISQNSPEWGLTRSPPLQEFHQTLHSLLLWLAQAEARLSAASSAPDTPPPALMQQQRALTVRTPSTRGASLQAGVCC